MTLIKSISGIRGTIGGKVGEGLSPLDIVKFSSAYGTWLQQENNAKKLTIVIGRDARISGPVVNNLVIASLRSLGINVVDLGLSTTPTVEMAVTMEKAHGGIIITASHNPKEWNALKLLNGAGEFISGEEGEKVLEIAEKELFDFADVDSLGKLTENNEYIQKHIEAVLDLPYIDIEAIKNADFSIVVDAVNSTGGIAVPLLLDALGVKKVTGIHCEPNGIFAHNPEPLPAHLVDLSEAILQHKADLGITVDPDVDRLAMVCEDGTMFGEEYTLVAVADFVLAHKGGSTVSNLSSTRALRDVTEKHGHQYFASAVGEVNVVAKMKEVNAVIGGEGNGGVILPELHYGRDALVGIAIFLTQLAKAKVTASELRDSYPKYTISKNKIQLTPATDVDQVLVKMAEKYSKQEVDSTDGVKIYFEKEWVHLRKSNTEPIIRIYAESENNEKADQLAKDIMVEIEGLM
ncbi:phosphoglucosamine mutase [Brumimicrobium mesophilum]|uniref:phosphoglucosamine mutase n=1 Tax=Brumimicrobium mesophilum TaxID=392717 RepID=UPI000D13F3E6|nr:phosphoglucosamine mutase [Brumimicrobium mesophilum]